MSLSNSVAQAVLDLTHTEAFKTLWKYYQDEDDLMVKEILSSGTDPVNREVLVRFREIFKREVLDLPDRALKQLNNKTAG